MNRDKILLIIVSIIALILVIKYIVKHFMIKQEKGFNLSSLLRLHKLPNYVDRDEYIREHLLPTVEELKLRFTDNRSYFYDSNDFKFRPYKSKKEVIEYLDNPLFRQKELPICIIDENEFIEIYKFIGGTTINHLIKIT